MNAPQLDENRPKCHELKEGGQEGHPVSPAAQKSRTRVGEWVPLPAHEVAALEGLLARARAAPSAAPSARNAVRIADGRIAVAVWRMPGGREGLRMQSKGHKPPRANRVWRWIRAAWPALGRRDVIIDTEGSARTAITRDPVEL